MSKRRLPEAERKNKLSIRLKQWIIDELLKHGKINEVLEEAALDYLKKHGRK